MKSKFILFILLFVAITLVSQDQITDFNIPFKYANSTDFSYNNNHIGCFFFNRKSHFGFVLLDSLYKPLKTFSGAYHTSLDPTYIGKIVTNDEFIYLFNRNMKNSFLTYTIDIKDRSLERKIGLIVTNSRKEEIVSAISYRDSSIMQVVSYEEGHINLITLNDELSVTRESFPLNDSVYRLLSKGYNYSVKIKDSVLSIMFGKDNKHLIYSTTVLCNIALNLTNGEIRVSEIDFELDGSTFIKFIDISKGVYCVANSNGLLQFYDDKSLSLLNTIKIDPEDLIRDKNIDINFFIRDTYTKMQTRKTILLKEKRQKLLKDYVIKDISILGWNEKHFIILEFDPTTLGKSTHSSYTLNDNYYYELSAILPLDIDNLYVTLETTKDCKDYSNFSFAFYRTFDNNSHCCQSIFKTYNRKWAFGYIDKSEKIYRLIEPEIIR